MDSVLTSDIFFFVTTCAVIILTAFVAFLLFHVFRLVKTVQSIAERLSDNIASLEDSLRGIPFLRFLFSGREKAKRPKRKEKKQKSEDL